MQPSHTWSCFHFFLCIQNHQDSEWSTNLSQFFNVFDQQNFLITHIFLWCLSIFFFIAVKVFVVSCFLLYLSWRYTASKTSLHRSSRRQILFQIGVLKNFAIFTGKHLCWSLFLIKLQDWNPATLIKGDSNTGVFLWKLRNC